MTSAVQPILNSLNAVILGKNTQIKLALACLLAKGHLLIEDLPGMGKTTLAEALARTLGLRYQRLQFTSDMLPADIIGVSIFNPVEQQRKVFGIKGFEAALLKVGFVVFALFEVKIKYKRSLFNIPAAYLTETHVAKNNVVLFFVQAVIVF